MAKKHDATLFIMGLILGAIIAGIIVLTSTNDKAKIVKKIKDKFNDLFGDKPKIIKKIVKKSSNIRRDVLQNVSTMIEKSNPIKKISVDIPKGVETLNLTPVKTIKPKMVFKKSK